MLTLLNDGSECAAEKPCFEKWNCIYVLDKSYSRVWEPTKSYYPDGVEETH